MFHSKIVNNKIKSQSFIQTFPSFMLFEFFVAFQKQKGRSKNVGNNCKFTTTFAKGSMFDIHQTLVLLTLA